MEAGVVIRRVRTRSGLSLRALAERAGTSHSTIAAYEAGRKVPTVETLDRIVTAAGHHLLANTRQRVIAGPERAAELKAVLDLAGQFPARHSERLDCPVFGR
jgi:transcriptional regulator with XRE-family HTH domain